jgi:predicted hydrolase (HD superfamily)
MLKEEQPVNNPIIKWASEQAALLLSPLGNRWLHVQGVARQAQWVSKMFDENNQAYLIASAYLHDIGYAPSIKTTGFHPLDGAYYLQSNDQNRLASLTAYHSEAQFEATLRGLLTELEKFPREYSEVADALTYCDLTTSPIGQKITLEERVIDILKRYRETDIVTQALRKAMPSWKADIQRTEQKLHKHGLIKP